MITVYLSDQKNICSEIVAIFDDAVTYEACLPALKKIARTNRMLLTENIDEEIELSNLDEIKTKIFYNGGTIK